MVLLVALTLLVASVGGAPVEEVRDTTHFIFNWDSMYGLRLGLDLSFGDAPQHSKAVRHTVNASRVQQLRLTRMLVLLAERHRDAEAS